MLFLFCRLSARFFRWFDSWSVRSSSVFLPPLLWLLSRPWFLCFRFVRRVFFFRFARPVRFSWLGGWGCRWFCCSVRRLPVVRRSFFVFAVRPAVVSRLSGRVLWVWVYGGSARPLPPEEEEESEESEV